MKKACLSTILVLLMAACLYDCAPNDSSDTDTSDTPSGPEFAIYDGEARPACTRSITRTDGTSPQTVDTTNWGDPVKVGSPISDNCPNDDPEITADGQILFFYWSPNMNLDAQALLQGTTGVYYAHLTGGPGDFGTPYFLELRKDTTNGAADGHPKITADGTRIYFHSTRAANTGYQSTPAVDDPLDIYTASLTFNSTGTVSNLGDVVNSIYMDGEQGISPDGTTLYFESLRPGGLGKGDIYSTTLSGTAWSAPVHLATPINTMDNEGQVTFAANDPDTMYFTSDRDSRGSAIYSSHFNGTIWEDPVLVVQGQVGSASLTADGSIMYFVHVLTDNDPVDPVFDADIYYILHK